DDQHRRAEHRKLADGPAHPEHGLGVAEQSSSCFDLARPSAVLGIHAGGPHAEARRWAGKQCTLHLRRSNINPVLALQIQNLEPPLSRTSPTMAMAHRRILQTNVRGLATADRDALSESQHPNPGMVPKRKTQSPGARRRKTRNFARIVGFFALHTSASAR